MMQTEAQEIARVFAETFQATPQDVRDSTAPAVAALRTRVQALRQNRPVQEDVQREIAQEFHADPSLAAQLFDALGWPRPFLLVQKDELAEMSKRAAAEVAGAIAEMVRDAPTDGPESRTRLLEDLARFVDTLNPASDVAAHLTQAFLRDPRLPNQIVVWTTCRGFARRLAMRLAKIGASRSHFVAGGELLGLALSGGGIRSATFNLGVLQALAEEGLLENVDILSTVSGGGYIGAWLAAWTKRSHYFGRVSDWLSPEKHPIPNIEEVKPIRMLRRFSNYLTPRLGMFSADTWTMAAVYVRNVLLNLAILVAGFAALLLVPRLLARQWIVRTPLAIWIHSDPGWHGGGWWVVIPASLLLALAVVFAGYNVRRAADGGSAGRPPKVQISCVAPLLVSAYFLSWWLWENIEHTEIRNPNPWIWRIVPGIVFAGLSIVLSSLSRLGRRAEERLNLKHRNVAPWGAGAIAALGTGIAGWALFRGYIAFLGFLTETGGGPWHALVWGPPLLLTCFSVAGVVHIGLLGVDMLDSSREWLSRLRAVTNIYSLFWLAGFCASIYGALWFGKLEIWSGHVFSAISGAWIATTVASFLAGRSPKTGDDRPTGMGSSVLRWLAKIGPPVFAAGFVWAVAIGVHLLVGHSAFEGGRFFDKLQQSYWTVLKWSPCCGYDWLVAAPLILLAICGAVALVLAWRVDINEFSMHHFYKNRLVRCYLGASNLHRKPNLFTGFDELDDIHLSNFRASQGYPGPYHIVNTTLNLSAGKDLAWQERKAASFIFTPFYCGYDASQGGDGGPERIYGKLRPSAYRKTEEYAFKGGIRIGTAMAISGAAADPNQGYNTSPAVAFLMTVFDVRLGWWLGNPRRDSESKLSGPRFGLAALISELSGTTDDATRFVSLSDGGHFDNMGIYELVRRRAKYIVLCDAEQDGAYQFGGLGMAIRKCRIDFGVEIEIDPKDIVPHGSPRHSETHCAVGRIRYPQREDRDKEEGVLVYIKSSMTGDEPEDLIEYSKTHPDFPHETTANQWFAESQFESYRKLGYHAARSTLRPARIFADNPGVTSDVFTALQKYWYPMNPGLRPHAIKHTRTLNEMYDKIAATPGLHKLGAQLFQREQWAGVPPDLTAEFYFCMSVLQLVEDIYFDFNLDRTEWRTDPRIGGWMNLFRQWKQVPAIQFAWEEQHDTFRKDFQKFWDELRPPGLD